MGIPKIYYLCHDFWAAIFDSLLAGLDKAIIFSILFHIYY